MISLLSYSDKKYLKEQNRLEQLSKNVFDNFIKKNREDIVSTEFYNENKGILDLERGGGYWLWKPYFILEELKKLNDGDIVIYMDCGDTFVDGFYNYIIEHFKTNDFLLVEGFFKNFIYTKRDCFILMNCDTVINWDANQLEAGVCGFKKNEITIKFVSEWLEYSKNENIITDIENISGKPNLNGFIDHRHDQSILTNLMIKYEIEPVKEIMKFIKYNEKI